MLKKILCTSLFLLIFSVAQVFAFQFSPLTQSFDPTGPGSTKTYTIINDSDDSIAIQISALTRSQNASDGEEVNTPASQYFSIFPQKTIVKPQSSQIVRVQYHGPTTVTSELSFRIKAEQLPYSQGKNSNQDSMFNFLFVYTTSAYVTPSQIIENVKIRKIEPSTKVVETKNDDGTVDKNTVETMAITLSNLGTVHQSLMDAVLVVEDSNGNRVKLSGSTQLEGLISTNILAKKTITRSIPWPDALSRDDGVKYRFAFQYNNK